MHLVPSSFLARSLVALLASAVALGVALVVDHVGPTSGDDVPPAAEPVAAAAPAPDAERTVARAVLRRWDDERSRAWSDGDPRALAAAYVPGSVAGRRDVARLRAWTRRGWRVERLTTQVGALRVVRNSPRALVLLVSDRVGGGLAVRSGTAPVALPHDRWDTRQVVLRRHLGRWRVASVAVVRLGEAATLAP